MTTTDNFFQFETDWRKLTEKAKVSTGTAMKKVANDLFRGIVQRTPVDTGRARANWFMTVGSPSQEVHSYSNLKSGAGELPPPQPPDLPIDGTKDVFITNNLAYVPALETGHSQQAPNGMVALAIEATAANVDAFVERE